MNPSRILGRALSWFRSRGRDRRHSLAELAEFPDMNPGPVLRLDLGGIVLRANRAAQMVFRTQDLLGACWLDVCPDMTRERWEAILKAREPVGHETMVHDCCLVFTHARRPGSENVFVYGTDLTDLRAAERALRQSERLATLGTLAAGVAHELNNPAAAAQRAAQQLAEWFARLQQAQLALDQHALAPDQREALTALDARARAQVSCPCDLSPMGRTDVEAAIEQWLEARRVETPWEVAPALVDLGYRAGTVEELEGAFPPSLLPAVVTWLSRLYPVYNLLEEIRHASARLSEIVGALRAYTYLGQAPVQAVDINQGLRNTLIILRNKLKQGVEVVQDLAADLPRIEAHGGELNQVWTNLIDNAVSAMGGRGRLTLRTRRDAGRIVVEIEDDGPGVPEAIQSRIFDPFFTTKGPGEGTGLGLHTTYNIVTRSHRGTIALDSRPGSTRFTVELPVAPAQA